MTGNRQIYDQAMNMGHSAAWDQEWDKAIAAYARAVQEMPEDPAAHNSLGLVLLQARRLEDALKVYTRAHQLAPDDPLPLEKSADVLERLGRLKEAAQQYVNVAEVYLAQRDLEKAIGNWERATRLTSGLVQIHQRLALAYERTGQRKSAIREYLTLAFNFQRANRTDIAVQAVERALRLEPNNPQALNTMQAVQSGALISPDVFADNAEADSSAEPSRNKAFGAPEDVAAPRREIGEADARGPIGEAMEIGLAALASYVFESGEVSEGSGHAMSAIDLQRQGANQEAVGAYQRALAASLRHTGIYLNLGALQLELEKWKDAIKTLELVQNDKQLGAGALHGISKAHLAMNDHRTAASKLIQTLRLVDVGLAINPDEADQLDALYNKLSYSAQDADEQQLRSMNARFLDLLSGPTWKQRVAETRGWLQEAMTLQERDSLVSLAIHVDNRITEGLNMIDRYKRQGLTMMAMDQAHYMLESAPDYLPIHLRLAQILIERNSIPEAIEKYNLIADTYRLRNDDDRAMEILQEAIKLAPMDIALHRGLIELLEQAEKWEQMLNQYLDLADAYYQMADLETASSTYQTALQLTQRINTPPEQVINIMHRQGEVEVSRLNLRAAMRIYEQIRKLDANDERARRALVDLNYRLNDPVSAVRELDGLLRIYAKEHKAGQIIRVLEEQVTLYPKDMALRSRLAAVYRQTGNDAKSIEQLDELAELQLEAGQHGDALVTLKRIISLNPPQLDGYKELLRQLGGQ
ncbi:MAG: tetratricopeptide repeat protein [Chloroflexi bacterium]|nr:tetratricopeptide repeat protein [Chloroflexota bacterium]